MIVASISQEDESQNDVVQKMRGESRTVALPQELTHSYVALQLNDKENDLPIVSSHESKEEMVIEVSISILT